MWYYGANVVMAGFMAITLLVLGFLSDYFDKKDKRITEYVGAIEVMVSFSWIVITIIKIITVIVG